MRTIAIAVVFFILVAGCVSQHQCPTYSKVKQKHESSKI